MGLLLGGCRVNHSRGTPLAERPHFFPFVNSRTEGRFLPPPVTNTERSPCSFSPRGCFRSGRGCLQKNAYCLRGWHYSLKRTKRSSPKDSGPLLRPLPEFIHKIPLHRSPAGSTPMRGQSSFLLCSLYPMYVTSVPALPSLFSRDHYLLTVGLRVMPGLTTLPMPLPRCSGAGPASFIPPPGAIIKLGHPVSLVASRDSDAPRTVNRVSGPPKSWQGIPWPGPTTHFEAQSDHLIMLVYLTCLRNGLANLYKWLYPPCGPNVLPFCSESVRYFCNRGSFKFPQNLGPHVLSHRY